MCVSLLVFNEGYFSDSLLYYSGITRLFLRTNLEILNTETLLDSRTNYISMSNSVPKLFPRSRQNV